MDFSERAVVGGGFLRRLPFQLKGIIILGTLVAWILFLVLFNEFYLADYMLAGKNNIRMVMLVFGSVTSLIIGGSLAKTMFGRSKSS